MTNIQILPIKKRQVFKISLICLLAYLFIGLFSQKINASGFSVEVYPPITKINAVPPVSLQTPIIIKNKTNQTEALDISFRHFTQSDKDNGQVRYLKSNELDLKDPLIIQRIKIFDGEGEISSLELAPQQEKKLTLRLDIPAEETVSDYYFSILFTSRISDSEAQKNSSRILMSVATNVLLSIGPKIKPNVEISEFSAPLFKQKGPVKFPTKIANRGNQFTTLQGYILIRNLFGQTVGRVDLDTVSILADTSRFIDASWPETFLVGPYTATLHLSFSDQGPALVRDTHFIGAPLQIAGVSLIVISLLIVIRNKLKSRLRR